jgi:hypothetical protein
MRLIYVLAALIVALWALPHAAEAQQWPHRPWQQQQQQQPPQQQWQPGRPVPQSGGRGACVPSGFARLTRNCSVNTGGCQRMPDNCNRGWCCP